ncbi:transposase [bacterium]|nr:transposase [bacterium]
MLAFSEIYCHFVWRINDDSPKMDKLTQRLVENFIRDFDEKFGYECIAVCALNNHIHFLANILAGIAPGLLVVRIKDELAEYLKIKLAMNTPPRWDNRYGIVSVSKSHLEVVKNYVQTQNNRHRDGKLNETLERIKA